MKSFYEYLLWWLDNTWTNEPIRVIGAFLFWFGVIPLCLAFIYITFPYSVMSIVGAFCVLAIIAYLVE